MTINSSRPPFNNVKVRQAVAYGLDRTAVVKTLYAGRGVVAQEFMPPNIPFGYANNVQQYPYNPEKAKALLKSAGLTLPVKVEFWYPTNVSRPYMPNPKLNFEAFADSLEKSGFTVDAHSAPWRPDYVKQVNDGTAGDLNLIGWTGDFGDPDNFVGTFFKKYSPQFGFRNAKLIQAAREGRGQRQHQAAGRALQEGEHHDREARSGRAVRAHEAGSRLRRRRSRGTSRPRSEPSRSRPSPSAASKS